MAYGQHFIPPWIDAPLRSVRNWVSAWSAKNVWRTMHVWDSDMLNMLASFSKQLRKSKIFMGSFPSNTWFFIVTFKFFDMNAKLGGISWRLTIGLRHQTGIIGTILIYLDVHEIVQCCSWDSFPRYEWHNCGHHNHHHTISRIHIRYVCFLWFDQLVVTWSKFNMR